MAGFVDHVANLREQIEAEANGIMAKTDHDVLECLNFLRQQLMMSAPAIIDCDNGCKSAKASSRATVATEVLAGTAAADPSQTAGPAQLDDLAARADAAVMEEYGFDKASLDGQAFPRRQVQALCKAHKIKANGKTAQMYKQLQAKYEELVAAMIDKLSASGISAVAAEASDAGDAGRSESPFPATTAPRPVHGASSTCTTATTATAAVSAAAATATSSAISSGSCTPPSPAAFSAATAVALPLPLVRHPAVAAAKRRASPQQQQEEEEEKKKKKKEKKHNHRAASPTTSATVAVEGTAHHIGSPAGSGSPPVGMSKFESSSPSPARSTKRKASHETAVSTVGAPPDKRSTPRPSSCTVVDAVPTVPATTTTTTTTAPATHTQSTKTVAPPATRVHDFNSPFGQHMKRGQEAELAKAAQERALVMAKARAEAQKAQARARALAVQEAEAEAEARADAEASALAEAQVAAARAARAKAKAAEIEAKAKAARAAADVHRKQQQSEQQKQTQHRKQQQQQLQKLQEQQAATKAKATAHARALKAKQQQHQQAKAKAKAALPVSASAAAANRAASKAKATAAGENKAPPHVNRTSAAANTTKATAAPPAAAAVDPKRWAEKEELERSLLRQTKYHQLYDIERIFGDVPRCDVEQIFPNSRNRQLLRSRRSSGNWLHDHVTETEKQQYEDTFEAWAGAAK